MAAFKASARSLDQGVGAVLHGLDEAGVADDTLVVLTTDHGLPFPGAKGTLSDRGLGVMLIVRGPGGFHGGHVTDALTSHVDLYPGDRLEPVLPNVDDSPSKSLLIKAGWGVRRRPRVELYDLIMDPAEMRNLAEDPKSAPLRQQLEGRLYEWMAQTDDPLLKGPVPAPPGAIVNDPAGVSAREPFVSAVD